MYEKLTIFLPKLSKSQPYESFCETVVEFDDAVMLFVEKHSDMGLKHYYSTLEKAGINLQDDPMKRKDISTLDDKTVVALIVWAMRSDRFSPGSFMKYCRNGSIVECLKRLKQIDQADDNS